MGGWAGGGAESYDSEKAWSAINNAIPSGLGGAPYQMQGNIQRKLISGDVSALQMP